jgi:hypothetical protein
MCYADWRRIRCKRSLLATHQRIHSSWHLWTKRASDSINTRQSRGSTIPPFLSLRWRTPSARLQRWKSSTLYPNFRPPPSRHLPLPRCRRARCLSQVLKALCCTTICAFRHVKSPPQLPNRRLSRLLNLSQVWALLPSPYVPDRTLCNALMSLFL